MIRHNSRSSLWTGLSAAGDLSGRFIFGLNESVCLDGLARESALGGRGEELRGRSVLVATSDQFTTAMALFEIDGVARRVVLYPPDVPLTHLSFVMSSAAVDAVVTDDTRLEADMSRLVACFIRCRRKIVAGKSNQGAEHQTEWILLTSGTTGRPKLVVHTLSSLAGAIQPGSAPAGSVVWSTFYDIRRYGGLQIFLRAVLTGTSLVLSSPQESTADFLARAGSLGVTHISGTPSHWRRALMNASPNAFAPQYVRLSGEIADQTLLNRLRSSYPSAAIVHAFASTEAGLAFEVADGMAGFPAEAIEHTRDVEMKIENRSLRIRSSRAATRYLCDEEQTLKGADGFVDTGDMLELRNGRYYFVGRRDGIINVGGFKVYPEEVEEILNRHPEVQMSLVRKKSNPITGAIVVAEIVLKTARQSCDEDAPGLRTDILLFCRAALAPHKVPASIRFVPALAVAESGKMMRRHA